MYANLTESQFKTFRADVRSEVRNIGQEIRREVYQGVVGEARTTASSTARKTVQQMVNNEVLPKDLAQRLANLEASLARIELAMMPRTVNVVKAGRFAHHNVVDEKWRQQFPQSIHGEFCSAPKECPNIFRKPKEWDVQYIFPFDANSRITFFRGQWRRDSEMKAFARQAYDRVSKLTTDRNTLEMDYSDASASALRFTNAGF